MSMQKLLWTKIFIHVDAKTSKWQTMEEKDPWHAFIYMYMYKNYRNPYFFGTKSDRVFTDWYIYYILIIITTFILQNISFAIDNQLNADYLKKLGGGGGQTL